MRILVAEDEPSYAKPLVKMLRASGYEVDLCKSTPELQRYIAKSPGIGFALLDLSLGDDRPVSEGLENIASVRGIFPFVPILLLTAHAKKPWIDQARRAGANAIQQKPPQIRQDYYTNVLHPQIVALSKAFTAVDFRKATVRLRHLSEDDLIDRIVIPLLRELGYLGVGSVSHHGPGEFGMDVPPFYQIDPLGDRTYCVAQVKAADITARARSSCNVVSVLNQVEAALRKEFRDSENLMRTADRVFLITSGKITPDARQIMDDWLKGKRQVSVFDGNRIVDLLHRSGLLHLLEEPVCTRNAKVLPISIVGKVRGCSWEDILHAVVSERCTLGPHQARAMYAAVLEREQSFATTIGGGIALPHAYNTGLDHQLVVVCASAHRYPWQRSLPSLVDFVVLTLFAADDSDANGIRRCVNRGVGAVLAKGHRASPDTGLRLKKRVAHIVDAIRSRFSKVEVLAPQEMTLKRPGRRLPAEE